MFSYFLPCTKDKLNKKKHHVAKFLLNDVRKIMFYPASRFIVLTADTKVGTITLVDSEKKEEK